MLLHLIDGGKLDLDKDLVLQFDSLDLEKDATNQTIRESRELSTYGIETNIDMRQLERIKQLILNVQKESIRILAQK